MNILGFSNEYTSSKSDCLIKIIRRYPILKNYNFRTKTLKVFNTYDYGRAIYLREKLYFMIREYSRQPKSRTADKAMLLWQTSMDYLKSNIDEFINSYILYHTSDYEDVLRYYLFPEDTKDNKPLLDDDTYLLDLIFDIFLYRNHGLELSNQYGEGETAYRTIKRILKEDTNFIISNQTKVPEPYYGTIYIVNPFNEYPNDTENDKYAYHCDYLASMGKVDLFSEHNTTDPLEYLLSLSIAINLIRYICAVMFKEFKSINGGLEISTGSAYIGLTNQEVKRCFS